MLALDAEEHLDQAPQVVAIVGTRTATDDPKPFYEGRRLVIRALRRRWPAEYACQVEFTTGKGPRSGGKRRPHWNLLLKGIPATEVDEARNIIRRVWCAHVDAVPEYQYVEALRNTGAFMEYVASHFQKTPQAPGHGWAGQRFNCSRGYFAERTRAAARQAARDSLQVERELWKAHRAGLEGTDAENAADEAIAMAKATEWRLYSATNTYAPQRADMTPGRGYAPDFVVAAALAWWEADDAAP